MPVLGAWYNCEVLPGASVGAERVVFNIKSNDYRLVVAVDFEKSIVRIKWIGTHADYDQIDVKEFSTGGEVKPIRSEADYEAALKEVAALWGARSGAREGDLSTCWRL